MNWVCPERMYQHFTRVAQFEGFFPPPFSIEVTTTTGLYSYTMLQYHKQERL